MLCARPAEARSCHYLLHSVSLPSKIFYVTPDFQVVKQRQSILNNILKASFPRKLWRQHLKLRMCFSKFTCQNSFVSISPCIFMPPYFLVMIFSSSEATLIIIFQSPCLEISSISTGTSSTNASLISHSETSFLSALCFLSIGSSIIYVC